MNSNVLAPMERKILLWRRSTQKIGMTAGLAHKKSPINYEAYYLKYFAGFFEFFHVVDQL